ncbi:MAG: leucine-rich repeat protein [Oscillospiraceae bacterium]
MKHVKKILSITSALLCTVGLLGTQFPEVNAAENVYGEFTYVLYDSNNDGKNDSVEITDCDEFVTRADIPDEIEGMPVTRIKDFVFAFCFGLTEITIPDSVIFIDDAAFNICVSLENINVSENSNNFCSLDGVLFNKEKTNLIKYPSAKKTERYTISNGVTKISENAFEDCNNLIELTIPESVKYMGNTGEWAISGSEKLESINVSENNADFCSVDGVLFNKDCLKSITIKNPKCEIYGYNLLYNYNNTICDKYDEVNEEYIYTGIIYGHENSTAQAYAEKYNIKFAVIGTEYNGVKGDANGDGKLRASDAAFIAKTLAEASVKGEKVTAENYPNADFNGDGKVTAADAAAIAKYLAEQSIKK